MFYAIAYILAFGRVVLLIGKTPERDESIAGHYFVRCFVVVFTYSKKDDNTLEEEETWKS